MTKNQRSIMLKKKEKKFDDEYISLEQVATRENDFYIRKEI